MFSGWACPVGSPSSGPWGPRCPPRAGGSLVPIPRAVLACLALRWPRNRFVLVPAATRSPALSTRAGRPPPRAPGVRRGAPAPREAGMRGQWGRPTWACTYGSGAALAQAPRTGSAKASAGGAGAVVGKGGQDGRPPSPSPLGLCRVGTVGGDPEPAEPRRLANGKDPTWAPSRHCDDPQYRIRDERGPPTAPRSRRRATAAPERGPFQAGSVCLAGACGSPARPSLGFGVSGASQGLLGLVSAGPDWVPHPVLLALCRRLS